MRVYIAVYDLIWFPFSYLCTIGHGGPRTAEYLKNNLFKNLSTHPDFIKDTKTAIGMKLAKFSHHCMMRNSMILFVYMYLFTTMLLLQLKHLNKLMLITSMKRKASKKMLVQLLQLLYYWVISYLLQMLVILGWLLLELDQVAFLPANVV